MGLYGLGVVFAPAVGPVLGGYLIELAVTDPILDIRVFRYWAFSKSLLLVAILSIALFTVLVYIPQFLQADQGWGAFEAGLALLP